MGVEEMQLECDACHECVEECQCRCNYAACEDGYMRGYDMPGFDYINDDPDDFFPCPSCRGSGRAKDRILW